MTGPDGKPILGADGNRAKMSVIPTRGPINTFETRFEIDGRHGPGLLPAHELAA